MAAGREENCRQFLALALRERTSRLHSDDQFRRLLELHGQRLERNVGFDVRWNAIRSGIATVACAINCTNQAKANLYSFHPGSCGFLMCDGSAHMVSENLSIITLCRLITFKGRSPVTDGF